jgi:hypothetical protein
MTATNEQILAEANRRWIEAGRFNSVKSVVDLVIEVTREGWTPPEPVDPDVLAFREWAACDTSSPTRRLLLGRGHYDNASEAQAYLAGARMAREQERERAKVLVEALRPYAFPNGSNTPLGDEFNRNRARALLKEADQ